MPAARPVLARPTPATAGRRGGALLLAAVSSAVLLAEPAVAAPAEVRRYALSTAQERVVLRLVDDLCGDTWCEGEHALRFRRFACHPRRGCVLRVQLASWSQEPLRWHTRSARVLGFPRYRHMVATAAGGERSLRPAFTEAVGRAVRTMTATVP